MFPDLSLDSTIATMSLAELEQHDVFSEVDEQIVELLYEALDNADVTDEDVQRIIAARRYGLWFTRFANDYDIIASASALRAMLRQCQPIVESITSPQSGFEAYTNSLYQVDGCYRRFIAAWKIGSPSRDRDIADSLEREYSRIPVRAWRRMAAAGRQDGQLGDCGYTLPNRVLCAQCEDGDGCA